MCEYDIKGARHVKCCTLSSFSNNELWCTEKCVVLMYSFMFDAEVQGEFCFRRSEVTERWSICFAPWNSSLKSRKAK